MRNNLPGTFTGSIDDFLNHCSTLDIEKNAETIKKAEKEEALRVIMRELEVDREQAIEVYNEISLAETKEVVDGLVKDGLVECIGHNEEGEPLFGLTELGKQAQKQILEEQNKKNRKKKKK